MGKALIIKGADFSQVAVDTIDIAVGQPTISINLLGNVTISSPNGEDIYYTTDGSTPTNQSTKYTAGFNVQNGTTVKAVCYLGGNYSDVASQLYDGTLQAPSISITNKGVVTITATDNASIRYTTDGSTPTSSTGTVYSGAFNVENGVVVKAIAYITDGGTTISSSVSSETAVVPEGATFGKKFLVNTPGLGPTGALTDDETRFVSPKIPITGGTSYSWVYKNATYQVDFVVEYNSSNAKNEYWNLGAQYVTTGSITKTAKSGTTYVRFSGLIGSAQAGMKITSGGNTLWEYDGSTE